MSEAWDQSNRLCREDTCGPESGSNSALKIQWAQSATASALKAPELQGEKLMSLAQSGTYELTLEKYLHSAMLLTKYEAIQTPQFQVREPSSKEMKE